YYGGRTFEAIGFDRAFDAKEVLIHVMRSHLSSRAEHDEHLRDELPTRRDALEALAARAATMDFAALTRASRIQGFLPQRFSDLTARDLERSLRRQHAFRAADLAY